MHGVEAVREPFGLAVHDDVDVALLPTRDRFAAVLRGRHEAERREHAPERLRFLVAGRELDELHAFDVDARRHRRLDRRARPRRHFVVQELQRAIAVDRDTARGAGAKSVVEDLERPIALVAEPMNRFGELRQRQIALPRHVAEMPAPAQIVHRQARRVGDLHEEQLVDADVADARARNAARQGMEAVENQADRRMIDVADQAPGIAMVEGMPPPRERLIADAHAAASPPARRAPIGHR